MKWGRIKGARKVRQRYPNENIRYRVKKYKQEKVLIPILKFLKQ